MVRPAGRSIGLPRRLPGGINGYQLAHADRTARPDLKVLFTTGYAENAVIGSGQLAPGVRVLTKPFLVEAFADHGLDVIEDRTSMPAAVICRS